MNANREKRRMKYICIEFAMIFVYLKFTVMQVEKKLDNTCCFGRAVWAMTYSKICFIDQLSLIHEAFE